MSASKKSTQPKTISVASALALWMKGTGRSELAEQTGLTRGKLRAAFIKESGKTWKELQIEGGRKKAPKQPKAAPAKASSKKPTGKASDDGIRARRSDKEDAPKGGATEITVVKTIKKESQPKARRKAA